MEGIGSLKQQVQALLEGAASELQQTQGIKTRIHFSVDGLPLPVYALEAHEGLNQVPCWQLHCAAAHNLDSGGMLGKPAELILQGMDGLVRTQLGLITSVRYQDDLQDQGHFIFQLESNLARLARRQRWRLLQHHAIPDLAEALLRENQLLVDNRLTQDYPVHSWLLQAGENDLEWLQRLLAEEGIGFYTWASEHGETVVLFDQPSAVDRASRLDIAVVADNGASRTFGPQEQAVFTQVNPWYQDVPGRVEAHIQSNPSQGHPQVVAVGQPRAAGVATDTFYLGGHPDAAEAKRRAILRLEYWQGCGHGLTVRGAVADLAPGHWLNVQGLGPCLVVSANVQYGEPDDLRGNAPRALQWQAELKPLHRPWRPPVPAKPELPAVFPARVEATTPYAELDGAGQYRTRLHLDQADSPAAQASPTLRQLQPFGGVPGQNGLPTGWDWPLRDNTQVLVSLLNNDFSQPYILGYLPASNQPGPSTDRNPSQYRLLTPAGNHLSMDDHKGAEVITLHTPQGHCVMTLDADSDSPHVLLACQQGGLVLRSGGDQHISVGKSAQTGVQGSLNSQTGQAFRTESQQGVINQQAATDMTLQAGQHLNLEAGANGDISVGGTMDLRANSQAEIRVGRDLLMKLGGDFHLQSYQDLIIQGDGSSDITFHQNGGGFTIKKNGTIRLFGNTVTIKGKQGVSFNGDMKWNVPAGPDPDEPVPGEVAVPAALDNLVCNFFALQCAKQSAAIIPLSLPEDKKERQQKPGIVSAYFARKVVSQAGQGEDGYTVKSGDSLSEIASQYGISWQALKSHNELSSDVIHPGQKLRVPGQGQQSDLKTENECHLGETIFIVVETENMLGKSVTITLGETGGSSVIPVDGGNVLFAAEDGQPVDSLTLTVGDEGMLSTPIAIRPADNSSMKAWGESLTEHDGTSITLKAMFESDEESVFCESSPLTLLPQKEHQITIIRKWQTENSTISEFSIEDAAADEIAGGYVLERPGPDTTQSGLRKRIPEGVYEIKWQTQTTLQGIRPYLPVPWIYSDSVSGGRKIYIHNGNLPKHTDGCLLVGTSRGEDFVGNSVTALKSIKRYLDRVGVDNVTLVIKSDYSE